MSRKLFFSFDPFWDNELVQLVACEEVADAANADPQSFWCGIPDGKKSGPNGAIKLVHGDSQGMGRFRDRPQLGSRPTLRTNRRVRLSHAKPGPAFASDFD